MGHVQTVFRRFKEITGISIQYRLKRLESYLFAVFYSCKFEMTEYVTEITSH